VPFELTEVTKVTVTSVVTRAELHGEERVRACSIRFCLEGENTLLDIIEPGLREHHFCNRSLTAGQVSLPDVLVPLPNLRFPHLPTKYKHGGDSMHRGYHFIRDFGIDDAQIDWSDCSFGRVEYEFSEGGSCKIWGTLSFNGEELNDNELYGEIGGLLVDNEIHIKLLAPPTLVLAKKGYRAGQPDQPQGQQTPDGQQSLPEGEDPDGPDADGGTDETPEGALANSLGADPQSTVH
jgi:hypothetical protein